MSEGFWWAALAIATLSAVGHLATMLGTRWGDRGASFKALLFSLLVHFGFVCALFAVGPRIDRLARDSRPQPEIEPEPIDIRDVVSDSDETVPLVEEGNVPLWDRPPETPATPEERTDRPFEPPAAAAETDRTVEPFAAADRPVPPVDQLPESPEATPDVAETPVPELAAETPTLEAEEDTAEARREERPPIARSDRSPEARPGEDEPLDRAALPPATTRIAPDFDPARQLADLRTTDAPAELPATTSPDEPLKIERPTTPLPLPDEEVAGAGEEGRGTSGDAALSERFSRRSTGARDFAGELPTDEGPARDSADIPNAPAPAIAASSVDRIGSPSDDLPDLSRPDAAPLQGRRAGVPETYQLRQLEGRSDIARRHGGTQASEEAVERSLKWLASVQRPEGYWDADAHGAGQIAVDEQGVKRDYAGKTADSGLTALAVLAFLGAGYTHQEGDYADNVERALSWLVANQREDGFLGGDAAHFEQMYCHGMATYALAEAYGMQTDASDARLRRPLERAILYIAAMQHRDGGWRYEKGQPGDMSMFGWQLMALKSAEIAGIPMPGTTRAKMVQFLKDRSLGEHGGLAAYRKTDPQIPPTPSMTAEALFSKQILGMTRTNPASVEAVSYLLKNTPKRSELNYYYWYYGTLALFQYGGPAWNRWNASLRDLLIAEQVQDGPNAGSWEPRDAWGPYGGRIYSTAVATLSLEVYYRFLPLYRATERPDGEPTAER